MELCRQWRQGKPGAGNCRGFIRFDYEITQLTVRALESADGVETHFCEPIGHVQIHGDYVESWQPQAMSALALQRAREISAGLPTISAAWGFLAWSYLLRGIEVWFSEVSPRPHDTGMVTMCSQVQSEFELHARAILGLPVDTRLREPGASAVIYGSWKSRRLRSAAWTKHCACRKVTCGCSVSRIHSPSAAWAWRWRTVSIPSRQGIAQSLRPAG